MKYKRLYLHLDDVADIENDEMISIKNDEYAAPKIRGRSIGQVTVKPHTWLHPDTEDALIAALASISLQIRKDFLELEDWAPWRAEDEDLFKVRVASDSVYLYFNRPASLKKITFRPSDISDSWVKAINEKQKVYQIRNGHVSSGSPEGGVIHFGYKLKK